jgi:ankyrin repeat protein
MMPDRISILIDHAKNVQEEDEDIISDWINTKTNKEKLTALHLAAFKGCLSSITILLKSGADKTLVNSFGLSVVHVAA